MEYVLRLETDEGYGIYVSNVAREICDEIGSELAAYDLNYRHPSPYGDSMLRRNGKDIKERDFPGDKQFFGFSSYGQFRSWFFSDEFLQKAEEWKVKLKLFAIDDKLGNNFVDGNAQCIFDKTQSECLGAYSPMATYEEIQEAIDAHKSGV